MEIQISRKDDNTYYLLFINDEIINGQILSKSELRQLSSKIQDTLQQVEPSSNENSQDNQTE
jgi:hypothetical protein